MSTVAERAEADLSKFFKPGLFPGSFAAEFTPAGQQPRCINVIFDGLFQPIDPEQVEYEGTTYSATANSSDVESAQQGDTLKIEGVTYYIRGVSPDGTGTTHFVLSKD